MRRTMPVLYLFLCCLTLSAQSPGLTLDAAVAMALAGNLDIRMAEQDVALARADLGAARADLFLPAVSLTGAFGYADPAASSTGFNDSWSAGLAVSKALFSGGRYWFAAEGRRLTLEFMELRLAEETKEIARAARTGFYNLILLKEKSRIAVEYDNGLKYRLESARINYANGIVSQLDYLKEQVRYKNYQPLLLKARNDYRMARIAYGNFIGWSGRRPAGETTAAPDSVASSPLSASEGPEPSGDILDSLKLVLVSADESRLVEAGLKRDLSLRSLGYEILVNETNRAALWAGRWPTLSGSFNYKFDYKSSGGADRSFEPGWSAGVSLTVPLDPWIPALSKVSRQLEGAEALAAKKRHQRTQTEAAVIARVRGLLAGLALAEESIAGQQENVKQAKLVTEIAQRQYREGNLSALDLSDAEVAYAQALANYWQALYDRYVDVLELNDYLE